MKIYSWNVLCFNKKLDEACRFIEDLDFDVLCLQEVTPTFLERLQAMPFALVTNVDVIRHFRDGNSEKNYVVILTRHLIVGQGTVQFPDYTYSLRTRLFVHLMGAIFDWAFISDRGAVYADMEIEGKKVRVFSAHLLLWGPHRRAAEYALLQEKRDPALPTVIAGDFNVIEWGPMKILNWLLGSTIREALPTYPERALFEKRFANTGLTNPLRGKKTHDFSRSQLDHILVPLASTVQHAFVVEDAHGSDHHPVGIEFTLSL